MSKRIDIVDGRDAYAKHMDSSTHVTWAGLTLAI